MTARERIVQAAAAALDEAGDLSTRGVAEAAGTKAPAIYRLFGDKEGLLDAVAEHVLATYVAAKAGEDEDPDPVVALRAAWDRHVAFGRANPAVFRRLVDRGDSPAARAGLEVLRARVGRVAAAGRLRLPEAEAVRLIHAAGTGAVLTGADDPALAATTFEALAAVLFGDAAVTPVPDARTAAVTLRPHVGDLPHLSAAERRLLREWLDRATS